MDSIIECKDALRMISLIPPAGNTLSKQMTDFLLVRSYSYATSYKEYKVLFKANLDEPRFVGTEIAFATWPETLFEHEHLSAGHRWILQQVGIAWFGPAFHLDFQAIYIVAVPSQP